MKRVFGGMHRKSGTGPIPHSFAYIAHSLNVKWGYTSTNTSKLHIISLHNMEQIVSVEDNDYSEVDIIIYVNVCHVSLVSRAVL